MDHKILLRLIIFKFYVQTVFDSNFHFDAVVKKVINVNSSWGEVSVFTRVIFRVRVFRLPVVDIGILGQCMDTNIQFFRDIRNATRERCAQEVPK